MIILCPKCQEIIIEFEGDNFEIKKKIICCDCHNEAMNKRIKLIELTKEKEEFEMNELGKKYGKK